MAGQTAIYSAKLTLSRKDGSILGPGKNGTEIGIFSVTDYVICSSWKNSAID